MICKRALIFIISILSLRGFALNLDHKSMSEDAQQEIVNLFPELKNSSTENINKEFSKLADQAHKLCSGNTEVTITESMKSIMKVGLNNYCDKYEDTAEFCSCVGSITKENYLTATDLEEFENKVKEENLKNIAFQSMRALTVFQAELHKKNINIGSLYLPEDSRSCSSPKEMMKSVQSDCSASELQIISEYYKKFNKENCKEDCVDVERVTQELKDSGLSEQEIVFAVALESTSQKFEKLKEDKTFNPKGKYSYESSAGVKKFDTENGYENFKMLDLIAKTISEKSIRNYSHFSGFDSHMVGNPNTDKALINLFSRLQPFANAGHYGYNGFTNESSFSKEEAIARIDKYLAFFETRIEKNSGRQPNIMSREDILKELNKIYVQEVERQLDLTCDSAKKTFANSCKAIRNNEISFNINNNALKFRDNNFPKKDKFKFDQMYCVANGHNEKVVEDGFLSMFSKDSIDIKMNEDNGTYLIGNGISATHYRWDNDMSDELLNSAFTGTEYHGFDSGIFYLYGYEQHSRFADSKAKIGDFSTLKSNFKYSLPSSSGGNSGTSGDYKSNSLTDYYLNEASSLGWIARESYSGLDLGTPVESSESTPPKAIIVEEDRAPASIQTGEPEVADINPGPAEESQIIGDSSSDISATQESSERFQTETPEEFAGHKVETPQVIDSMKEDFSASANQNVNFNNFNDFRSNQYEKISKNTEDKNSLSEEKLKKEQEELARISSLSKVPEESIESDTSLDQSLEIQKLKLELEKAKLDLAKTEQEVKSKKLSAATVEASSEVPSAVGSKAAVQSTLSDQPEIRTQSASVSSQRSPVSNQQARSNSSFAKRDIPSTSSTQASAPSVAAPTAQSSAKQSSRRSGSSTTGQDSFTVDSSNSGTNSILTATSLSDEQVSREMQVNSATVQSVKSIDELESSDQDLLQEYYNKGTEFVVSEDEENLNINEKLMLKKDDLTGLISVVKITKQKKRAPASKPELEEKRPRKVFSYDEFKTILDSSREE